MTEMHVCLADAIQKDNRRKYQSVCFPFHCGREGNSPGVRKLLKEVGMDVYQLFQNTLDTTVHFRKGGDGKPDTFSMFGQIFTVIAALTFQCTGLALCAVANADPELKEMLVGLFSASSNVSISIHVPNAFNDGAIRRSLDE